MKKLLMMVAAVAGLSMFAMTGNAEASCRYGGGWGGYRAPVYGYGGGYGYRAPIHRGGYYGHPGFNRGYYGHPGFNRGFYGHPGFNRSGFAIQSRGFGLYIR